MRKECTLSGVVTLSPGHAFDRESSESHFFTVEARDEVGKGNRNSVELTVAVRDVNDNAPVFRKV